MLQQKARPAAGQSRVQIRRQSQGASHEHRTLCLSAQPARVQGDGGRQSSRSRLHAAHRGPDQGRAEHAAIRSAQSQHAHAHAQGRRPSGVGVERDLSVSRGEETRERPAAQGRDRAARRDALAVLGSRALGSDLRRVYLRIRGQAVRAAQRRTRHGGHRQGHRGVPPGREGAGRAAQGQAVRHRRYPDARGFLARRGDEARRHGALPARTLRRDQTLVRDAERAPGLAEDAGADRNARRQRGVTAARACWTGNSRLSSSAKADDPVIARLDGRHRFVSFVPAPITGCPLSRA